MLKRLTHAGIAFAVLAAFYQGYVAVLVPFVEPAAAAQADAQEIPREILDRPPESLKRYQPLLSAYFAPDHWCFHVLPKIIENGQALIVFDRYEQNDSGMLRVPRCAIVYFPSGRDPSGDPPRDAVILEPADGATLQMDQTIGQKFGSMGRMQFGQLLGAVHVRSDMKEPGPQDDLSIETKDLYMNEDLIRTTEAVTFHLGGNHGTGRGLEIRFLKTEKIAGAAGATLFGKLNTLEITREVAGLIAPGKTSLFGQQTAGAPNAGGDPRQEAANDPAQITCSGPFRIEFNSKSATFTENVEVSQLHADGALDELTAHELTLYFDEMREWGGETTPTSEQASGLKATRLQPATIRATGLPGAPVVLNAPSHSAVARGERISIELKQRQVTLEGGEEVSLTYRGAEIHAPRVQYNLPPKDSNQRLGIMDASGGSGRFRAAPDPARPTEVIEVNWQRSMKLVRSGGKPLLRLDGRPRVSMIGGGTLWADQLELYLRENAPSGPPVAAAPGAAALPASIEAERIVATGHVGIESAELNVQVNQLDLRISNPAAQAGGGAAAGAVVGGPVASATAIGGGTVGPAHPSLLDRNRSGRAAGRAYNISGAVLELDAVMRNRKPELTALRVDGSVVFQESTPGAGGEAPMRILAEHLAVTEADTQQAKIEIRGGDATGTLPAGLAEISARDTVLRAPALAVNRGTSQAWINSPGEVQLLMTRDATGKPLPTPQPLRITWRDSMQLDRDHITFLGNVHVQHADGWLRTRRLVVVLTAPVQFDGAPGGQKAELAQLECWEGAIAEFDQRDTTGAVTAHQAMNLESLIVNQVTGEVRGDGPGHIDSIHFSKGDGSWLVMPDAVGKNGEMPRPVEQDAPPAAPKLNHLSVDFVRGVDGNIHTPEIRVYGDVHTIYGPVERWDQRLKMTAGGAPGPDTFWITCDTLQVSSSPLARIQSSAPDGQRRGFGLIELSAETNVVIEGEHPTRGAFTFRGHRATFDQAKTMFVLEGDGRLPATVTVQQFPGGPFQDQSAQKIMYWKNTGVLKVVGFSKIDYTDFGK